MSYLYIYIENQTKFDNISSTFLHSKIAFKNFLKIFSLGKYMSIGGWSLIYLLSSYVIYMKFYKTILIFELF